MTRVEVVATDHCVTCKGKRWIDGRTASTRVPCPTCGGTGETRRVVTCGGCRWFARYGVKVNAPDAWGTCLFDDNDDTDPRLVDVNESFACASWQAKETA